MNSLPDRHIPLKSVPNLRDLGGLSVAGGHFRPREMYRSATLSSLVDAEMPAFDALGIRTVYDLRTVGEAASAPDHLPEGVESIGLDVLADSSINVAARVGELVTDPQSLAATLGGGQGEQMLEQSYRDIVSLPSALAAYRAFYLSVVDSDRHGAALFHCTTGKDRTGWAAASLLTALGASRETVFADYLETNADLLPTLEPFIQQAEQQGIDRELLLPVLGVQQSYLEAAFTQMEEQFGSIERYLTDGLGLGSGIVDRLRERFVDAD